MLTAAICKGILILTWTNDEEKQHDNDGGTEVRVLFLKVLLALLCRGKQTGRAFGRKWTPAGWLLAAGGVV